ncbi:MAG TPA: DUF362 domain-containing protein [Armatimonadetes bacterium]|nr:DUF362 domain-containing protein [Armatimonadota bacterium]
MTRREFVQQLAALAAVGRSRWKLNPSRKAAGRVFIATGLGGATTASLGQLTAALTEAVNRLTDSAEGWRRLFRPEEVVGLKVNCLSATLTTHPVVVEAIIEGLRQAGVRDENIVIFDRRDAELAGHGGFSLNRGRRGVRCFGCKDAVRGGVPFEPRTVGSTTFAVSTLLTRECTALVNVPVLKDHSLAEVTLSLKNHFGSIRHPLHHHGPGQRCDPQVAQLNSLPEIRLKTRLLVGDALTGMYEGGPFGPGCLWDAGLLLVATDPVALDTVGWRLINERRLAAHLPPHLLPAHVRTAAQRPYHLGCCRAGEVKTVKL